MFFHLFVDACHTLTCALMLLNTDLHTQVSGGYGPLGAFCCEEGAWTERLTIRARKGVGWVLKVGTMFLDQTEIDRRDVLCYCVSRYVSIAVNAKKCYAQ